MLRDLPPDEILIDPLVWFVPVFNNEKIDDMLEIQTGKCLQIIPVLLYMTSLDQRDIPETYDVCATHFLRKPNSFEDQKEIRQSISKASPTELQAKRSFVLKRYTSVAVNE